MQQRIKENYTISGYFVFFLIAASQAAATIFNFQSLLLVNAGQDAWISIILMGASLHLVIWMIYKMLSNPAKDVIEVHQTIFGKFLGNALSLFVVGYYFLMALYFLRSYIEIIQVWVFPSLRTWVIAALFICIIYYVVSGGFRVVAGFCFFYLVLMPMLFWLYFPARQGELGQLLPVLNHSLTDVIMSSKSSCIIFFGLEPLLVYLPFLKSSQKHAKWAHFALMFSTIKYTVIMIVTLMFFSQGLLKHTLWPTMSMTQNIEFSFIARFEYVFIFLWQLIIIPTVCIPVWCCTRMIKRVCSLKPGLSLPFVLTALLIAALALKERTQISAFGTFINDCAIYFHFAYIPLLFIVTWIVARIKRS